MVEWHCQLDGHEFEQTLGDSEEKGNLAGCSPQGRKESELTEQLNDNSDQRKGKNLNLLQPHGYVKHPRCYTGSDSPHEQ